MPAQHNLLLLILHAFISCHFFNNPFTAATAVSQNTPSNISPDLSSFQIRPLSTEDTDCIVNDEESKWNLHGIPGDGYYITAHIGTPPQPVNLLVDTGSSNLAVAGSNDDQVDAYFKPNFSSSFMMFSNSHLRVAYTQGWWEGFLGSDVVVLPSLSCHLETRSFVALIRRSHGFYVTGSHWQGILGLAFPELAQPNKSIQPWFESLLSTHNSSQRNFALHTNDSVEAVASSYQQHVQERQNHSNNLTISAEESHPSAIVASSFLVPGLPYSSDDKEERLPLLRSVVNKVRYVSNGSFRNNSIIVTNMSNPKPVDKKPYVKSNFTRSNFNLKTIKVQLTEDDINIFNQSNWVEYTTVRTHTRLLRPVLDSDGISNNTRQSNSHLLSNNDTFNGMSNVNSVSNVSGSSHENKSHKYKVTNENKMDISSRPLVVVENSHLTDFNSNLLSNDDFKDRNVTGSSNQIILDSHSINRSYSFNKSTNTNPHNYNKKKGHGDETKSTVDVIHQGSGFTKSSRSVLSNTFGLELCGPWSSPTHDTHVGRIVLGANVESCGSGPWLEAPILQPWFYEVAVAGMAVGGKPLSLPCTLYNTHASIVDSGTTKLKLPDKVLNAVLSELESASQALLEPLPANFWRGDGRVCWTQAHTAWSVLPSITVQLAVSNTSIVSISLGPRSYLRPSPPVPATTLGLQEKFGYVDDFRSDTSSVVLAEENLNRTWNLKQSDSGVKGSMAYTAVSDGYGTQAGDDETWTTNASLVSSSNVTNPDSVFELSDRDPSLVIDDNKHILDFHRENNGEVPEFLAVTSSQRQSAVTVEVYNEETPSGVTELISPADSDAYNRSMLSKVRTTTARTNSDAVELNIGGRSRTADAHLDVDRENGRVHSSVLNSEASELAVDGVAPSASSPSFARDPGLPPVPCWTSGIEASNMGTVLGVVVLEGLCVRFDRERGMLGFRPAACGPVVEVTGPHQHQGAGACVSSSHGGGAGTTVLAALLAVLCCPLLLYAARCLYITHLRRRRRASEEAADEVDANGSAGTPFLVLDDNPAVV